MGVCFEFMSAFFRAEGGKNGGWMDGWIVSCTRLFDIFRATGGF